jgi:hypothetical protein
VSLKFSKWFQLFLCVHCVGASFVRVTDVLWELDQCEWKSICIPKDIFPFSYHLGCENCGWTSI